MIDFACRTFSLEEVIKCGLGLTKADIAILSFLINNSNYFFATQEMAKKVYLDLSTVQRSVKKLYNKNLLVRKQENLKNGGYVFYYRSRHKKEIKEIVMKVVENWAKRVEKELEEWS